ncbi:DUF5994 family protein [Streptomyces sp. NPDC086782]|uniref:DUF5994 family protein n=1 Tax=Streptomyces sp. NPDC086782 TaxID=3365757 RepID=UPI0037FA07B6
MWWPRSRALTRELPSLTAALGGLWGRITGVTVNPAYWPVLPHWVSDAGRTVHVGWSTEEQDPHRLTLFSPDGRWDMLVIPTTQPSPARYIQAAAMSCSGIPRSVRSFAPSTPRSRLPSAAWYRACMILSRYVFRSRNIAMTRLPLPPPVGPKSMSSAAAVAVGRVGTLTSTAGRRRLRGRRPIPGRTSL